MILLLMSHSILYFVFISFIIYVAITQSHKKKWPCSPWYEHIGLLVQSICENIVQNVVKAWNLADMSQRSYQSLLASDPILKMAAIFLFWKKLEITVEKYYIDKFWWNLVHSLHIIITSILLLHTLEYWKRSLMVAFI